jgi:hypothetical protein
MGCVRAEVFSLQVIQGTTSLVGYRFSSEGLPSARRAREEEDETLPFAHYYIVDTTFKTLVIVDESQDQVFLFLWIYQMAVSLVVPDNWFNIVDIEVD